MLEEIKAQYAKKLKRLQREREDLNFIQLGIKYFLICYKAGFEEEKQRLIKKRKDVKRRLMNKTREIENAKQEMYDKVKEAKYGLKNQGQSRFNLREI